MKTVCAVDDSLDPSQLRWVGDHFVYFLDIYWTEEESLDSGDKEQSILPRRQPSLRELTLDLLEDVMDAKIPLEQMLVHDDTCGGHRILSGDKLSRLIVPWARVMCEKAPDSSHHAHGECITQAIIRLASRLDDAIYASNTSLLQGREPMKLCTVMTFLTSLSRCIRAIWGDSRAQDFVEGRTRMFGEVAYTLRTELLAPRWGERASVEMERLLGGYPGIPFVAYALDNAPTVNHVETVDTANYKPQHISSDCTCEHVVPSFEGVRGLLQAGQVPVVVFDGSELTVQGATRGPYVAISHVWADGLGSVTEDGLPLCQVRRLDELARRLNPNGAFWQDGLCVPEDKPLRRRAIGLMAETYENADKVLVIDSGIRSQCSLSAPKEACLLRIATSGWVQRIWTLQEGMLARELYFEVADGVIDCTHFNGAAYHTASGLIPILQYRCQDDSTKEFRKRLAESPKCTLNDIIALLRYRTTSHPEDEPLAIAGLLGVDASELLKFDDAQQRMKALLMRVKDLPRQLAVFGWLSERLAVPNFTWAPRTLSDVIWPGDADDPLVATCNDKGLFGTFTVVRLSEPITILEHMGIVMTISRDDGDTPSDDYGGQRPRHLQCTRAGCASRVLHLVLSPMSFRTFTEDGHFFRRPLTFNAFIMKQATLPEATREEGVGVVQIVPRSRSASPEAAERRGESSNADSPPSPSDPLVCKFVAPGSVALGAPDTVETIRSRSFWLWVGARMEPLRRVRLT
ncbi:hypothetical protein C8Q74DRAFT_1050657 [Fomes fomentarius]|nr:hypothetical protein C8Q74DRAFT_1050657 [Fomes fomentarius]